VSEVWAIRGDQALPTGFWAALKSHHSGGHEPAPLVVGQVTNLHTLGHLRSLRDPDTEWWTPPPKVAGHGTSSSPP